MKVTINEFITECENYEYSNDFYEMTKDLLTFNLQTKYIENQMYLMEKSEIMDNDYFTEADSSSSGDSSDASNNSANNSASNSSNNSSNNSNNDSDKKGIFGRIKTGMNLSVNTVINFFIRFWNFMKSILRKLADVFPKFGNWINKIMSLENTELREDWFTRLHDHFKRNSTSDENDETDSYPSMEDWQEISDEFINNAPEIKFTSITGYFAEDKRLQTDVITKNILTDIIASDYIKSNGSIDDDTKFYIFEHLCHIKENENDYIEINIPKNVPIIDSHAIMDDLNEIMTNIADSFQPDKNEDDIKNAVSNSNNKLITNLINNNIKDSSNHKIFITLDVNNFQKLSDLCKNMAETAEKYQNISKDMVTNYFAQIDKEMAKEGQDSSKIALLKNKTDLFKEANIISAYINYAAANTMKFYQGFGNLMKSFNKSGNDLRNSSSDQT